MPARGPLCWPFFLSAGFFGAEGGGIVLSGEKLPVGPEGYINTVSQAMNEEC